MFLLSKESPCYKLHFGTKFLKIGIEFAILEQKQKSGSYLFRTQYFNYIQLKLYTKSCLWHVLYLSYLLLLRQNYI